MKKVTATILMIIYFAFSAGATLDFHYCMGKLASWDLGIPHQEKCGRCGMEKKDQDGCCKDQYQKIQVSKDHKAAGNNFDILKLVPAPVSYPDYASVILISPLQKNTASAVHAPPLITRGPVFLLNCFFLI